MDAAESSEAGGTAREPETAQHHHTQQAHSTPEGAQHHGTGTAEVQCINFTPDSQFDSQQLLQALQGPPLSSQDLMLGGTQTQDCSLQQEMLKAERESAERHQTREQEAAAALREEAAQADPSAAVVPDPLLNGQVAAGAFLGRNSSGGMTANDPAAAAAAGGGVSEDLLKLAQVAYDEQQGQQGAQDPYAAAMQAQFDPAAWAAYGGMPMGGMNAAMLTNYYWGQPMGMPSAYPSQRHPSLSKPEHQGSNAKRRGPMDEMRQLQRILTKLLPGSIIYMPNQDGGGNKVQADDIKVYIAATLGEAPKPDWGLKNGWGQYLADLFNWATGREGDNAITRTQAMACARRPQGRSWEVVFDKLMELGVYSWNWELPLRHEQVLNCHKTPPPELTRQQEALAAATAAAAAAAAVTAGANPDAIPNLPVVARMASLLGKRQHQQMNHMGGMSMGPPPMMFGGMHMDAGGDMMAAAAAAAAMPAMPTAAVDGGAGAAAAMEGATAVGEAAATQEPAVKKQRSSSSPGLPAASEAPAASSDGGAAAAAAAAGAAPAVNAAPTQGVASAAAAASGGGSGVGISDAELALPPLEVLQAASIQQLMTFVDNALTGALQATQGKVLSGTARCPSMEYIMNMKNFKLDPLYASYISLVMQAGSAQAAMEQHMAQQAAMQQAKAKVKSEAAAASSSRAMGSTATASAAAAAAVPMPASTLASSAAVSAGPASSAVRPDAAAAAAAVLSDAQAEQDSSAAVAAAMAAAAAAAASMAPPAAVAAVKAPAVTAQAAAAKALGKKKGTKAAAARDAQQDYMQQAKQQSAVQAAAAEAAMAAAARLQQQQKQPFSDPEAAAAHRLRQSLDGYGVADKDSEDAAMAAAMALSALAGSQEVPEGLELDYQGLHQAAGGRGQAGGVAKRRVGGSRLANGSGRAAHTSPMKPR